MTRRLAFEGPVWQVAVLGLVALCCAGLIGLGAAWGGYEYGRQTAPVPTALAMRTYTEADLAQALRDCGADGAEPKDGSVTLLGTDYAAHTRQCVAISMGATPRAVTEFSYDGDGTPKTQWITEGSYNWSNVAMTWKQTNTGRDLTITVGDA